MAGRARVRPAGGGLYDEPPERASFVTSGCSLLDCVLGKGWPVGRISNIVGDKSTGKTLLAIEACANFARRFPKGRIKYVETEGAFDKTYAASVGLPASRVEFPNDDESKSPVMTVETLFAALESWVDSVTEPLMVVVDSWDALSDDAEVKRDMSQGTYGQEKAKKTSQMMRRLVLKMKRKNVVLLIISQVRDNIGVTFGKKHTRSGGKALDFYASIVLWLAHVKRLEVTRKKTKRVVGVRVRCKTEKNKCGAPFRECDVPLYFSYGIDDVEASFDWFEEHGKTAELADASGFGSYPEFVRQTRDATQEEFYDARMKVARATRKTWKSVESMFAPSRSKYGSEV